MLARDLVDLHSRLKNRAEVDLFNGERGTSALRQMLDVQKIAERVPDAAQQDPVVIIKLVLQALDLLESKLLPHLFDATFVATMPGELPVGVATTSQVVMELLTKAKKEIVALGYEISHRQVLQSLVQASARGVRVALVTEESQSDVPDLLRSWPTEARPDVYVASPASRTAKYSKMHSKAIVVDAQDLFVTSANLTFGGLTGNIEFGVRIAGRPARDARKMFEHMVKRGVLIRCGVGQPPIE